MHSIRIVAFHAILSASSQQIDLFPCIPRVPWLKKTISQPVSIPFKVEPGRSLYEQAAMARSKSSGLTSHHFFKPSKAGLRLESA